MKNILIVGGTGMLWGVTQWLNAEGNRLTLIARNQGKLERLSKSCKFPEHNQLISLDYRDSEKLRTCIQEAQNKHGNFSMVLAWIHSIAPDALRIIIEEISGHQEGFKLFHVLGSSNDLQKIKKKLDVPKECDYYQIQLGFIIEDNKSRWLTNEEISNGVIEAIREENKITVVGTLHPWDMRP